MTKVFRSSPLTAFCERGKASRRAQEESIRCLRFVCASGYHHANRPLTGYRQLRKIWQSSPNPSRIWNKLNAELRQGIDNPPPGSLDLKYLWKIATELALNGWVASTCGICEFYINGQDELHCQKQFNSDLFQEYCLTGGRYATRIPEGAKGEEVRPVMCGGVTAYVA